MTARFLETERIVLRRFAHNDGAKARRPRFPGLCCVKAGAIRVFATTMTVNTPSRKAMEEICLKFARTLHSLWPEEIEGAELGNVEYA